MKSTSVKAAAVLLVITLLFAQPAAAILGLGDIVFDPSNLAQAIQTYAQIQQQYMQLVQIYQQTRLQYDQLRWMAQTVPVDMQARYRSVVTPWINATATNTYGTTGAWISSINSGAAIDSGYANAVQKLLSYGSAFSDIPSDQADRIKTSYGTVELTDSANIDTIRTIGQVRGNAPAMERILHSLEDDSLSSDPAMNTEVAVLNKINAANLIGVRTSQDTNKLLVNLAEEQLIEAKRTRDAEAQAINQHVRFMTDGQAAVSSQSKDASAAMLAWKMP